MDTRRTRTGEPERTTAGSGLIQLPVAEVRERPWQVALETLRIRSSWLAPVEQPPVALIQRYEKTDALIQKHRLPVKFFGYAPLFNGSLINEGSKCDWAIMNLPEDPFYNQHKRKLYAPRCVIADMKKFCDVGLSFDAIFIAHEIAKGAVRPGGDVPFDLIAPPPTRQAQQRLKFLGLFWPTVAKWLGAAATQVSSGLAALAARDPVLFGVQFDPNWQLDSIPIGMWYYLTHWFWDEGERQQ
jgi:hypothetical protein